MGSDFDLSDLLKPHLSPALPQWKRTRVLAGQLDHNITIASTLTFQASLIISTTPHWKQTRVLAGQLDHNITIARTLTFQAPLITSTTPHWKRTQRVLAGQM